MSSGCARCCARLIDNALKFTPTGGRVAVAARTLENGGAEVTVSDSGIGMSAEELEHVFEPFWQADSGLGRTREGAGIGLKLARQLDRAAWRHAGDGERARRGHPRRAAPATHGAGGRAARLLICLSFS